MSRNTPCDVLRLYKKLGVDVVSTCESEAPPSPYAAVDAYIDSLELPLASKLSFCGEKTDAAFCVNDSAIQLTVLSILGTYSRVLNTVFFVKYHDNEIIEFLDSISEIQLSIATGAIVSVSQMSVNGSGGHFRVVHHNTKTHVAMSEDNMLRFVSSFTGNSQSLIFHLDDSSTVYSTRLYNGTKCMWVSKSKAPVDIVGSLCSEFMPMLYAKPGHDNILRLNIGRGEVRTHSTDETIPRTMLMISSMVSARSRDNLCYNCAYMKKLHSVLCSTCTDTTFPITVALESKFASSDDSGAV